MLGKDELGIAAQLINNSIADVHVALVESVQSASSVAETAIRIASSAEETS
ncbi:hypothetical protein HND97_08870 [Vibrio cholerae]|nr:hypothetical protein HND97_08870 [Vibrio cholerae]